ncbi:MAG: nuclear transport factor 2 family protein [Lentisphaeria bacterium]
MIKKARAVLNEWMLAVNRGDLERLLALYSETAVLIPTFSNRLLNHPDKIRDYFATLGSREELSIALHEKTVIVQPLKSELCSLSGIYCWRFLLDGELLSFEARFSYVLDLASARPIVQHHSSQIPRVL